MAAYLNVFRPHSPQQELALFFATAIGLLACGIQFGKTKVGSVWMKLKNHTFTDPTDNFLIVAPTYKILTQSTLPPYLQIMKDFGIFSKADMTLKVHGGGTVYMRSATDPDSVVGITNIRAIWGDEAGLFSLYFSENLAARAAFRAAQTLYTTSPYTLNWLYKDIIRPKMRDPKARPDVTLIQAASWENPYFPREVIDRNRLTMDSRRFNALFGGQWERPAGMVYDCYDEDENQVEPFQLPAGTRFVGGIDWGFNHPFVFKVRAITPEGRHYGVSEFYQTGLTIADAVKVVKQRCLVYGVGPVYCDPAQPAHIEELCRHKIQAIPAENDIRLGIDRHYELLKTRRLKFFRGMNPHTLDEIESYHYPEPDELDPDDNAKDHLPVKQHDDAMDCDRYITVMTFSAHQRHAPSVPSEQSNAQESHETRIKRLSRRPRVNGTESWSA